MAAAWPWPRVVTMPVLCSERATVCNGGGPQGCGPVGSCWSGGGGLGIVAAWTGRETRALRLALRMTVETFAAHLGAAPRTVAYWEERRAGRGPPGGSAVLAEVDRFADSAASLLRGSYAEAIAPGLHRAVGGARQLAGWVSFDAGQHANAQRPWGAAERSALSARDAALSAQVRYSPRSTRESSRWSPPPFHCWTADPGSATSFSSGCGRSGTGWPHRGPFRPALLVGQRLTSTCWAPQGTMNDNRRPMRMAM